MRKHVTKKELKTAGAASRARTVARQQAKDRDMHRGYYIVKSLSVSTWYVSKDGHHIGSAGSLADAKKVIDALLD